MIAILKNNFERIKSKKSVLFIACVIMPLLICIAISFSNRTASKEKIAVSINAHFSEIQCNQYEIIEVKQAPLLSELVSGEYVAYIEICDNGKIEVTSLKSNQDTNAIKTLFETGKLPEDYKSEDDIRNERGIGTNILGFITMLILMQGVALSVLYPEERIKKTLCRVMCSPVSSMSYLSAQFIFTLLCLFIPTYIAICIIHLIFGINIGLSLGIMALLLFLVTLFATSFALFISTMLDRNTNLIATGISIITCILAGCFIPITTNNPVITWILKLIPQTEFMDIVHSIEFGVKFNNFEIFYILLWTFLLLTISITISQKRIQKGNY